MEPKGFKDTDALAFEEGNGQGRGGVFFGKRKRHSKGLEIVFDQDQHRQALTLSFLRNFRRAVPA